MYQAILDKYAAPQPAEIPAPEIPAVDPAPAPAVKQPVFDTSKDAWKQYPSVVTLSYFLRENRDMGVRVVLLDGRPTLHLNPGMDDATSAERRDVVDQAFDLLLGALEDLEYLIQTRQYVIPNHPGYVGVI